MKRSHLEQRFAAAWTVRYPDLVPAREYVLPVWKDWAAELKRRGLRRRAVPMRADFAWPLARVALEIQGGTWVKSGHSSGGGIERDATKAFLAQCDGWVVLCLTEGMLTRQADVWLPRLAELIRSQQQHHARSTATDSPADLRPPL